MDWTLLSREIPEREDLYLIQYMDGDIETLHLDDEDIAYLNGVDVYVAHTYALDLIHAWIPASDLPPPPAISKKPGTTTLIA
jgi:hypothetical protein